QCGAGRAGAPDRGVRSGGQPDARAVRAHLSPLPGDADRQGHVPGAVARAVRVVDRAGQEETMPLVRRLVVATLALGLLAPMPADAKTFKWAFTGDVATLDPYAVNETFTVGFLGAIYEGLVMRGKNLEIVPGLATSWSNVSPDVWRFKLRPNVKFHDGTPFTPDDV